MVEWVADCSRISASPKVNNSLMGEANGDHVTWYVTFAESPLMIGYFALNVPAGLGLYWFIGHCVGIIQQYFVVGWGTLLPGRRNPGTLPPAGGMKGGGGPKGGPDIGPRSASDIGPRNGPRTGPQSGLRNSPQNGRNRGKRKR